MEKLREFFNTKSLGSLLNDPKFIGTSAAIVMAFYYMRHKGEREAIKSSFDCQSIELPVSNKPSWLKCCNVGIMFPEYFVFNEVFLKYLIDHYCRT